MKSIDIPFNEAELNQLVIAAKSAENSSVTAFWDAVEQESIQRAEMDLAKPVVPEVKPRR